MFVTFIKWERNQESRGWRCHMEGALKSPHFSVFFYFILYFHNGNIMLKNRKHTLHWHLGIFLNTEQKTSYLKSKKPTHLETTTTLMPKPCAHKYLILLRARSLTPLSQARSWIIGLLKTRSHNFLLLLWLCCSFLTGELKGLRSQD